MSHNVVNLIERSQFFKLSRPSWWPIVGSPRIESSHNLIRFPLRGIQVRPFLKKSKYLIHRLKIGEPWSTFGGQSKHFKWEPWKYFFHNTSFLQESLSETIFQRILAPKEIFWEETSRSWRPPSINGSLILSQLNKWSFLSLILPPSHRKHISSASIINLNGTSSSKYWHPLCQDTKGQFGLKFPKHYRCVWTLMHYPQTSLIYFYSEFWAAYATMCIATRVSYPSICIATHVYLAYVSSLWETHVSYMTCLY